jgi:hypothetical protein
VREIARGLLRFGAAPTIIEHFGGRMTEQALTKEEVILRAMKQILTSVVKDTATPPGMIHPLKDQTISAIRDCLGLISERERELAAAAGRPMDLRPHFTDDPKYRQAQPVVVPLSKSGLIKDKNRDEGD